MPALKPGQSVVGDTAADWAAINPILQRAIIGIETDTGKMKIGDGSTSWADLDYAVSATIQNGSPNTVIVADADGNLFKSFIGSQAFSLNLLPGGEYLVNGDPHQHGKLYDYNTGDLVLEVSAYGEETQWFDLVALPTGYPLCISAVGIVDDIDINIAPKGEGQLLINGISIPDMIGPVGDIFANGTTPFTAEISGVMDDFDDEGSNLQSWLTPKAYVDMKIYGSPYREPVLCATNGNIDLSLDTYTSLDGQPLADGDRVLLVGQTDATENGIYVFVDGTLGG